MVDLNQSTSSGVLLGESWCGFTFIEALDILVELLFMKWDELVLIPRYVATRIRIHIIKWPIHYPTLHMIRIMCRNDCII